MSLSQNQNNFEMIAAVQLWVSKVVIGLNFCPFAKPAFAKNLIRYMVCSTNSRNEFLDTLETEVILLSEADPLEIETTLLIHPNIFLNFLDQNDFLEEADMLLEKISLDGIIQIANFHPEFQFAHRKKDDITNYVNRAPYPILHLLREDSISRVVDQHPDINSIYKNNKKTLRKLGYEELKNTFKY